MKIINTSLSIRNGRLFMEDCDLSELAQEHGTPLFVVSENHLRSNYREFRDSFSKYWPEGDVCVFPALKAYPSLALRRIFSEEGAGCDCYGPGELEGAIRGNTKPELISVNGSIKNRSIIRRAIEVGARIVLDSSQELEMCHEVASELGKTARIMFRPKPFMADLNTDSDFYPPGHPIRELTQRVKYGIPTSDVLDMGERAAKMDNIEVIGIHIHMGRHSKKLEVWEAWVEACVNVINDLNKRMGGWLPKHIDLGGGFPNTSDRDADVINKNYPTPSLDQYAKVITDAIRRKMSDFGLSTQGITLEMEPGRGIYGNAAIHLASVRNVKRELENGKRSWAEIDTAETFLGVAGSLIDDQPLFDHIVTNKADAPCTEHADIVGQTCGFELLIPNGALPPLENGDVIALLNTGAYAEPMACNFNSLPRPPSILVSGNQSDVIKRRESVEEVYARDVIPARFRSPADN